MEKQIAALKNPELREEMAMNHPSGNIATEIDAEVLSNIVGGDCGPGWFPSITGECTCDNGITVCSWSGCC
ncbi:hypothetical protein ACTWP4_04230 [Gracilibacillus sp. D59]|uniref:hypothetical protein n=1 Tax=Gracilibacillus sp. D59 TaxID=3457434 RepID=UPI003FCC3176